jgi:oligopeptide/dipeptide ABC transporter ATP-binding protein
MSILRLLPCPPAAVTGRIRFLGEDLLSSPQERMRRIRGNRIAMIFQEPMTALNPVLTIGEQVMEVLRLHRGLSNHQARREAAAALTRVGLPEAQRRLQQYPHQLSGGLRQRALIAMALACDPELLIADEPTTALDVTIQAQILEIIKKLSREFGTAVILITHDLGVVAGMCNNICVMYAGRIVEKAPVGVLYREPKHPYTQGLIKSVPRLDRPGKQRLHSIDGQPPNLIALPDVCAFHPRCEFAMDICRRKYPPETPLDGRMVRCWLYEEKK